MTSRAGLTAAPAPTCVAYRRGWVAEPEQAFDRLSAEIAWEQKDITIFGRTVATPRLTCWIGDVAYTTRGCSTSRGLPPMLVAMRDRLDELTGVALNSCLANLYRDGTDSMGYHSDDEPELGDRPTIARSVSAPDGPSRCGTRRPVSGGPGRSARATCWS